MNGLRNFFEVSRDFHKKLSEHERVNAYYAFALAAGTAAMTGGGVYIAIESDATIGLIITGLGGYATKLAGEMGVRALQRSAMDAALAEERRSQLEDLKQNEEADQ